MGTTNWLPGIVALGIGLVVGLFLALRSRKATVAAAAPEAPPQVRDLSAERDLLIARLREMGDANQPSSARERYRLELEAARVLVELDRERPAVPAPAAAAAAATARSPFAPFLWGVVATSAIFGLVLFVMSQSRDRAEGGTMTGNAQAGPPMAGAPEPDADAPAQPDPELDELKAFADSHPDSVDAWLDLAQAQLQRDQLVGAFESAQKVLQKEPENPRGLTYTSVVRSAMGQVDQALTTLDSVVKRQPDLAEAWVYRGLVAADAGRYPLAIESWETALKLRPDGAEVIRGPLERVRQLAKDQAAGTGAFAAGMPSAHPKPGDAASADAGPLPADHPRVPGALPPGHPPMDAPATPPAAPAAAGGGISGTITLAPGAKVSPGAILFVSVRADGQMGGPPVAAKRLPGGPFPMAFTLGPQDSMMGLPWPEHAQVEARLDSDGNAMSRDPADPQAKATGVVVGQKLTLVLAGN